MFTMIKEEVIVISSDDEGTEEDYVSHKAKRRKMTEEQIDLGLISGVNVQFPLKPYKCQMELISKVIRGCKNKEHCLLESPTGSGKTLALLCSALAWQNWYRDEMLKERSVQNNATASVIESNESSSATCSRSCSQNDCAENLDDTRDTPMTKRVPKIFYCTRTHRQIKHVVKEFERTAYKKKKMTILSSREQTCIQEGEGNKTERCNELLDPTKHSGGCRYYNENNKGNMSTSVAAERLGLPHVWDIEDLVKVGRKSNCCPYFAARDFMEEAEIVFCPYNYLIDPKIREAMRLYVEDDVIILDEAHNMEDTCSEVANLLIKEDELERVLQECKKLASRTQNYVYETMEQFVTLMLECMKKATLRRSDRAENRYEKYSCKELLKLFNDNKIDRKQCTEFEYATKEALALLNTTKDQIKHGVKITESESNMLSHFLKQQVEKLLQLLETIMSVECMDHYMVIMREQMTEGSFTNESRNWIKITKEARKMKTMKLLCLNPGLIFKQIAQQARCVVLTSGTLAPTESFTSELKTDFKHTSQGKHVIPKENVYVNCISRGPKNFDITLNFETFKFLEYQEEVLLILWDICKTVPHGVLCFFTSYWVLELMLKYWRSHEVWDQITNIKYVFKESTGEMESVMNEFRNKIRATSSKPIGEITGCLLLGVMRGKLAEGEDFKDDEARCVVTVGLPYPNKNMEMNFKINYNNLHVSEGLLNGNEWYNVQAYRALNQALGRCIRHANDWGAVLLIDCRFMKPAYRKKLPRWVQNVFSQSINPYSWKDELQRFISRHKTITDN